MTDAFSLLDLPDDVLVQCLQSLSVKDTCSFRAAARRCKVCCIFHGVLSSNLLPSQVVHWRASEPHYDSSTACCRSKPGDLTCVAKQNSISKRSSAVRDDARATIRESKVARH